MPVPPPWAALSADEKRSRALAVADELFARDGLDVAMPVLAEAIGVGVGSIYRQVGTKDDLIGALVIARARELASRFDAAAAEPDAWAALCRATRETVADCVADCLSQSAWDDAAAARADVAAARADATRALHRLVEAARAQGTLCSDADAEDLRLAFKAVRELASLGETGAQRLAELVLRGIVAPGCGVPAG